MKRLFLVPKRLALYIIFLVAMAGSAHAEVYRWLYDLKFEAPDNGQIVYNTRDRLEMVWADMTFVVQVYSNNGVTDELLKQNLQRRAAGLNMYDTRTDKYNRNSLKGFCLKGTLPDGSTAEIYNVVSKKSGMCLQFIVNYTRDSEKVAKKLVKSIVEDKNNNAKKDSKDDKPVRKQKIQKKDAPPKPIKKSSTSPAELYEI